jgi:hypothetical protein
MAYIPKNKIKTNLFTNGGEFSLTNNKDYVGPYHKLYNGKTYTGATPDDPNSVEIFSLSTPPSIYGDIDIPPQDNPNISYDGIVDPSEIVGSVISIPSNPVLPTAKDYFNKEFTRYFNVKRNEPYFTEISKTEYDKYKAQSPDVPWKAFKVFSLSWQLTGDVLQVAKTNKNITEIAEFRESAPGLSVYLKNNWIQYFKFSEANNLYTDGKSDLVLKTPNGQVYVGPYHINPDKGYMVGATHTNTSHESLNAYYQGQKIVDFQPYVPPKKNPYNRDVAKYNTRIAYADITNNNNRVNNSGDVDNGGGY